jgi:hypothetical protein
MPRQNRGEQGAESRSRLAIDARQLAHEALAQPTERHPVTPV